MSQIPRNTATSTNACTCSKLRRLTRRVTAVYDRALAEVGMRVTQYSVLNQLRRLTGPSMSELADALDMDRTTLTRNLKPMLDAGWVEVRAAESDARMRSVHLTPAGEKQLQVARSHWRRAQNEVNATIGEARIDTLHALIDTYLPLFRPAEEETQ